jgi:hypothetical protein
MDHIIEDGICKVGSGWEDEEIGIDNPRLIGGFFASGEGLEDHVARSASLFYCTSFRSLSHACPALNYSGDKPPG